jgi:molybdopterin/thiamine biosynthesis adenylyltransferase
MQRYEPDRIAEAGVNTRRLAEAEILIRVDALMGPSRFRGHPAETLCRALTTLGVRNVCLAGGDEFFDELVASGEGVVQHLPGEWSTQMLCDRTTLPDIVVDFASGGEDLIEPEPASSSRPALWLTLRTGATWTALWSRSFPKKRRAPSGMPVPVLPSEIPWAPVARIATGLALQEIVIHVGRIHAATPSASCFGFDLRAESRTWQGAASDGHDSDSCLDNVIIDVIGAGAVGSHVLECLVPHLADSELRVFDPDVIAVENLNLSTMYGVGDIGRPKASTAASRLSTRVRRSVRILPFVTLYETRPPTLQPPSIRISCVDNFATRCLLNELSLRDGVPLVDAGTSPLAGQVRPYIPGRTACLVHQIPRLKQKATHEEHSASCWRNSAPTLPGVNMVVAGMQVAEVLRALRPEEFGQPSSGTLNYDCRIPRRISVTGERGPCVHEHLPAVASA